jgi:hypothetical protein
VHAPSLIWRPLFETLRAMNTWCDWPESAEETDIRSCRVLPPYPVRLMCTKSCIRFRLLKMTMCTRLARVMAQPAGHYSTTTTHTQTHTHTHIHTHTAPSHRPATLVHNSCLGQPVRFCLRHVSERARGVCLCSYLRYVWPCTLRKTGTSPETAIAKCVWVHSRSDSSLGVDEAVVGAAVVLCNLLAAPLMFVTAKMAAISLTIKGGCCQLSVAPCHFYLFMCIHF